MFDGGVVVAVTVPIVVVARSAVRARRETRRSGDTVVVFLA